MTDYHDKVTELKSQFEQIRSMAEDDKNHTVSRHCMIGLMNTFIEYTERWEDE